MKARTLLAVSPNQKQRLLRRLEAAGLEVCLAESFEDAWQKLSLNKDFELLFLDAEVPGGDWQDLLEYVAISNQRCEVIVCCRVGDEKMWAEALQCGAYDLIAEPYAEQEVARVVAGALRSDYLRRFSRAMAARAS